MPNFLYDEDDGYCPDCGADLEPIGPPGVMHASNCSWLKPLQPVHSHTGTPKYDPPAPSAKVLREAGWIACIGKYGAYFWNLLDNRTRSAKHQQRLWVELYKFNTNQRSVREQQEALAKARSR